MPRVDMIRIKVSKGNGSDREVFRIEDGTTIESFIMDDYDSNPNKFRVLRNGVEARLCDTLSAGDELTLLPQNYSSGM